MSNESPDNMEMVLRELLAVTRSNAERLERIERQQRREDLLEQGWFTPAEVEQMAMDDGRKVSAETVRCWVRWERIDGDSDGDTVKVYRESVEELRSNKWKPTRKANPDKMPPSKRKTTRSTQAV